MRRRAFLRGTTAAVVVGAVGRVRKGLGQSRDPELPPGFALLRATQGEITIAVKRAKVYHLLEENGTQGYVGVRGQRFRVVLDNATTDPLSVHWHGLVLPNGQDGVAYVTQRPLTPGERRLYDFPLEQAGTYWMHSHWGLQEQSMMTAPLILRDPSGPPDEHDVVMMLNDFTDRDPAAILADLAGPRHGMPSPGTGRAGMKNMPTPAMPGMAKAGPDLSDVKYDAVLANRRPLSDPDVIRALPGRPVRLRIVNAASGTNFLIRTGALRAEAIAVDGADIAPLPGQVFELAVAQRIDLRVRVPRGPGTYPILAQEEGTDMLAGLVLATPDANVLPISARASHPAGALSNAQERRLVPLRPLV